jgi:hypothetical protein
VNRELTALDIPGRLSQNNHINYSETNIEYLHKYETQQNLKKTEEEIQEDLNNIKGVLDIDIRQISDADHYEIQVSLQDKETIRKDSYQQILEETTAHNGNYSTE